MRPDELIAIFFGSSSPSTSPRTSPTRGRSFLSRVLSFRATYTSLQEALLEQRNLLLCTTSNFFDSPLALVGEFGINE